MTLDFVPKLVAMDTSILAALARDLSSHDSQRELAGKSFVTGLYTKGWIPVISRENILEMLRHGDELTVNARTRMFAVFPQLAHVDSVDRPGEPGDISDILAREVDAYLEDTTRDAFSLATAVRTELFRFCDGFRITTWLNEKEATLRQDALACQQQDKLWSSLSHVALMGSDDAIDDSIPPDTRIDQAGFERFLAELKPELEANLRAHGVKGLDEASYTGFIDNVLADLRASFSAAAGPDGSCTKEQWLQARGTDLAQVTNARTTAERGE
jgi:hypothetical protein